MTNTKKMTLIAFMLTGLASLNVLAGNPIFYPAAPEQPRLQFLKTMNGASFFGADSKYGKRFPNYKPDAAPEKDSIGKPYGVAMADGKIFVCDAGQSVVRVFDLDKKFVTKFGDAKAGKLVKPMNIVIGEDGTRYVADAMQGKILVYDSANLYLRSFGDSKTLRPTDLVLSKGKIYVTDMYDGVVKVFDPKSGNEISKFAKGGFGDTDLVRGTNIAADQAGNIYVADSLGGKISVFTENGKSVRNIGQMGDGLGQFARARGVALDRENRLYAVDAAFENVQIFNKEDKLLMPFGEVGNISGGLNMPAKVTIDYNHNKYFKQYVAPGYDLDYVVLVTNQFGGNRVNIYGFLKKL